MRWPVVLHYTGLFLKIFSALLLVPVAVGKALGESFVGLEPYILAAFIAIVAGWLLGRSGRDERPDAVEAMTTATISWLLAVGIGAIPFILIADMSVINAYFESMAGFTTTGMSLLQSYEFPQSFLFWRAFIQWIGGLGILTFFVAVLVETGGVATKLVAQEANKTSSGTIRASLFNAIKSVWYVYIVFTVLAILLLMYAQVDPFNAVVHSMVTLPTGGFASAPLETVLNPLATTILTVFMFIGGVNFLLLYLLLQGNIRSIFHDYEFRLYGGTVLLGAGLIAADLFLNAGTSIASALSTAVFHSASVLSSTGFELQPVRSFPELSRTVFFIMMFVGGSLGSTTGGVKMLRIGIMIKLVRQQVRALKTAPSVMNHVLVNGRVLREPEVAKVAALFFAWVGAIVTGMVLTVAVSPHSMLDAAQLFTSAIGTMGPTFLTQAELIALHPVAKAGVMVGMLAGRLELLPLLGILNVRIAKHVL